MRVVCFKDETVRKRAGDRAAGYATKPKEDYDSASEQQW